jgi:hypothetical protein
VEPKLLSTDVIEVVMVPIAAAIFGIFLKWANSSFSGKRGWKPEYASVGLELLLAAFIFLVSFTFKVHSARGDYQTVLEISAIQLVSMDPSSGERVENPDTAGKVDHCGRLADSLVESRENVDQFRKIELSEVTDPKMRLEVANCQRLLLAQRSIGRLDTFGLWGPLGLAILPFIMWTLSIVIEDWGHVTKEVDAPGAEPPRKTKVRELDLFKGILVPDIVGLVFLLLVFSAVRVVG